MDSPNESNALYVPVGSVGCDHRLYSHVVQFYYEDDFLVRMICEFAVSALQGGDGVMMLATRAHHRSLARRIFARGIDVDQIAREGRYLAIDALEIMNESFSEGVADFSNFRALISRALLNLNGRSRRAAPRAMVFGELVSLLWMRRASKAVLALEQVWENLAADHSFTLFCSYSIRDFADPGTENQFLRICAAHSTLISPDQYPSAASERRILTASQSWHQA